MKLNKKCNCCNTELTTKNVYKVASGVYLDIKSIYVNCVKCNSTLVLAHQKKNSLLRFI